MVGGGGWGSTSLHESKQQGLSCRPRESGVTLQGIHPQERRHTTPQLCTILDKSDSKVVCLGQVGLSICFCLALMEPGYLHCRVATHGRGLYVTSMFGPKFNSFYVPGGITSGQPIARMDPFILQENVPSHMLPKFKDACLRMADKWICIIQEAVLYNNVVDDGVDKDKVNKEEPLSQNEEEEDGEEESSTLGSKMDKVEVDKVFNFKWETPCQRTLQGTQDAGDNLSLHCKILIGGNVFSQESHQEDW